MSLPPYIDFHTHAKGAEREVGTPSSEVLVVQSLFYPHEVPHPRADFTTLGWHPMQSDILDALTQVRDHREHSRQAWKEHIASSRTPVIAIGEAGWDKRSPLSPEEQTELVRFQVELSQELGLPMVFHIVGGWHQLLRLKKEFSSESLPPWIVHGFRGNPTLRKQLLDSGILLSYHPYHSHWSPELLESHSLLLETDDTGEDIRSCYQRVATELDCPLTSLRHTIHHNFTALRPHLNSH